MPARMTLIPEDEASVDRLVASGRYATRDAVMREAIRLVTARDEWSTMAEAAVAEGRADIAAGRVHSADEVFGPLVERYRTWPK